MGNAEYMGIIDYFRSSWQRSNKYRARTQVSLRPRMHKRQRKEVPELRLRRSHGPRLRSRKSLTTPSSLKRGNMRRCSRRSQRFFASPEPCFVRSSRLEDLSLELSSETCLRKA